MKEHNQQAIWEEIRSESKDSLKKDTLQEAKREKEIVKGENLLSQISESKEIISLP
jgi:hypothetical protein